MIAAHDESAVIHETLDSVAELDYPAELFECHVVADNCTDDTASIVRSLGFSVHERTSESRGKGPALNWLLDQLLDGPPFDAVVIVDADTTVDPRFLRAMDVAMTRGALVAQGYYGVRNANASAATRLRSIALTCRHHLRPLGRRRLGGSCGLYGNGMAFRRDILLDRRWSNHLVEDAQQQLELLQDGTFVEYVPEAVVLAEMPATAQRAHSQQVRWEQGRIDLVRSWTPRLVRGLVKGRRRVAHIDALLDLLVPPLSVLFTLHLIAGVLSTPRACRTSRRVITANVLACIALVGHVAAAMQTTGASRSDVKALAAVPSLIVHKFVIWSRSLLPGGPKDWIRTTRNAEVDR